jgi:hypothetical protein
LKKVPEARIRALGFDWPCSKTIEEKAIEEDGLVDLEATLERLKRDLAFYDREIQQMHAFARQWGAEVDDITDNRDDYGEKRLAHREAIDQIEAIMAALGR